MEKTGIFAVVNCYLKKAKLNGFMHSLHHPWTLITMHKTFFYFNWTLFIIDGKCIKPI